VPVMANDSILVGNDSFLHVNAIAHDQCEFDNSVAHIAVDGRYAGYITIGDDIRPDARDAVQALRNQGVDHIAMLTGDNVLRRPGGLRKTWT
jgi:Cd2+/Zn2+-exporting ATPase